MGPGFSVSTRKVLVFQNGKRSRASARRSAPVGPDTDRAVRGQRPCADLRRARSLHLRADRPQQRPQDLRRRQRRGRQSTGGRPPASSARPSHTDACACRAPELERFSRYASAGTPGRDRPVVVPVLSGPAASSPPHVARWQWSSPRDGPRRTRHVACRGDADGHGRRAGDLPPARRSRNPGRRGSSTPSSPERPPAAASSRNSNTSRTTAACRDLHGHGFPEAGQRQGVDPDSTAETPERTQGWVPYDAVALRRHHDLDPGQPHDRTVRVFKDGEQIKMFKRRRRHGRDADTHRACSPYTTSCRSAGCSAPTSSP